MVTLFGLLNNHLSLGGFSRKNLTWIDLIKQILCYSLIAEMVASREGLTDVSPNRSAVEHNHEQGPHVLPNHCFCAVHLPVSSRTGRYHPEHHLVLMTSQDARGLEHEFWAQGLTPLTFHCRDHHEFDHHWQPSLGHRCSFPQLTPLAELWTTPWEQSQFHYQLSRPGGRVDLCSDSRVLPLITY